MFRMNIELRLETDKKHSIMNYQVFSARMIRDLRVNGEILQGFEFHENFSKIVPALICDEITAIDKSEKPIWKNRLRINVKVDGL